jgi:spore coat polysaccharide biosynthesis protein SpsF (cytidylyltransferase family)
MKSVQISDHSPQLILATTSRNIDDVLVYEAKKCAIQSYRGPKENVLKRYYGCAMEHNLDIIVRLTADNPYINPNVIEKAIEIQFDFLELPTIVSTRKTNLPPGLDVECFNLKALELAQKYNENKYDREHVTTFMYSDDRIRKVKFETSNYSYLNIDDNSVFTIDEPNDYIKVSDKNRISIKKGR